MPLYHWVPVSHEKLGDVLKDMGLHDIEHMVYTPEKEGEPYLIRMTYAPQNPYFRKLGYDVRSDIVSINPETLTEEDLAKVLTRTDV